MILGCDRKPRYQFENNLAQKKARKNKYNELIQYTGKNGIFSTFVSFQWSRYERKFIQ